MMDSEQKFWLSFWKIVGLFIFLIVLSLSICHMHSRHKIAMAIKDGIDPLSARVAFIIEPRAMELFIAREMAKEKKDENDS
jgi:hypothetical protein